MDRVHPVAGWGERTYKLSSHQRPKASQTGLSLGLVFVTVFLGRWILVFAGVVFEVVTFGGGGRVFSFFVLVQVLQRSGAGPAICHGVAVRVPGLQPTPSSAIAKEEAAKTVGLRLPSMSTNYVFACVV